ncbi:MAG: helix-turn-helix domain-containing protein [Candidatus Gracilibacteria bacterium]|nr:helix-turn-helix domain-containing protein [Candidatus Gracilibacteria bacterium]
MIGKNEFDILKKIIEESGKIVYRQELMDLIGYSEYLFDRTIDTHIKNIRKKIKNKDIILTVRGEGYRLNN